MSYLEFQNVGFQVDGKDILRDINLEIEQGEFVSLVGASGSGKSTLLKMAADLIPPTSGRMVFRGKDYSEYPPTKLRRMITLSFQTPYLFGDRVRENMNFPYQVRDEKPDEGRMKELLDEFGMCEDYLDKEVRSLSGGEAQRIALIRSLLFEPEVLLLDEVTSALDPENTEIVEKCIERRNKEEMTVVWITHDPEQSRKYADILVELEAGEIVKEEVL